MVTNMGTKITQWIKLNLTLVICGTLAAVSIVLIALGMFLPEAQAKLDTDKRVYDGLQSVRTKAANERVIEDIRRKQNEIRRNVQAFLASAARTTPRTLLHANVFPKVSERHNARQFKEACDRKRGELLAMLNAKDRPDEIDISDFRERIRWALQREAEQEGKLGTFLPGGMNSSVPGAGRGARDTGGWSTRGIGGGAAAIPEDVTPEEWIKQDAEAGASVERCREIHMYANDDAFDPLCRISDQYPSADVMWAAQVSLWIQEDIIQVLARLNKEVADQLPEEERYVANLPIKHLLYIALSDPLAPGGETYSGRQVSRSGVSASSLEEPVAPPSTPSFTKREVGETLDVINVAVGLVIDANHLLKVIDGIGDSGFYTPLLVSYEAVPYDPNLRGYIYGPAPVIRVRLEFEHCILRDKLTIGDKQYVELMPESIKSGAWPTRSGSGRPSPTRTGYYGEPGIGGGGGRFSRDDF